LFVVSHPLKMPRSESSWLVSLTNNRRHTRGAPVIMGTRRYPWCLPLRKWYRLQGRQTRSRDRPYALFERHSLPKLQSLSPSYLKTAGRMPLLLPLPHAFEWSHTQNTSIEQVRERTPSWVAAPLCPKLGKDTPNQRLLQQSELNRGWRLLCGSVWVSLHPSDQPIQTTWQRSTHGRQLCAMVARSGVQWPWIGCFWKRSGPYCHERNNY